jgi:hypothetical protein
MMMIIIIIIIQPRKNGPGKNLQINSRRFLPSFFSGGTWGTAATTGLLYQPRMIGDEDCGEIDGMKIGK